MNNTATTSAAPTLSSRKALLNQMLNAACKRGDLPLARRYNAILETL